jgi:hypothetical protein
MTGANLLKICGYPLIHIKSSSPMQKVKKWIINMKMFPDTLSFSSFDTIATFP